MVKTEAERIDEHVKLSSYFRKHYEVDDPDLWQVQCLRCKCIFAVDWRWFKYKYSECGELAEIGCPYCHKVFLSCN